MQRTLAELRALRGLTQRGMAKQLGISASAVALYELGLRTPSLQRAKLIAQFFGVPVEAIVFGPVAPGQGDEQAATLDATGA